MQFRFERRPGRIALRAIAFDRRYSARGGIIEDRVSCPFGSAPRRISRGFAGAEANFADARGSPADGGNDIDPFAIQRISSSRCARAWFAQVLLFCFVFFSSQPKSTISKERIKRARAPFPPKPIPPVSRWRATGAKYFFIVKHIILHLFIYIQLLPSDTREGKQDGSAALPRQPESISRFRHGVALYQRELIDANYGAGRA